MEEDFRALLRATPGVFALVGASEQAARVDWGQRPQGDPLPAIVLHLISAPAEYTQKGRSTLGSYLIQIDCWAEAYGAAALLARSVADALDAVPTGRFRCAEIEGRRSDNEAGDGSVTTFFRTSLDVRVWFSAA